MAQTSEEKRLKSLNKKKENYKQQKTAIQQALSNIDKASSKKILFDDDGEKNNTSDTEHGSDAKKRKLFDDDEENDDLDESFAGNFQVKKQFEGKKGQKLLALQTRFQSDDRFKFDERFNENEEEIESNIVHDVEDEKTKQLEILSQIVGKKIKTDKVERKQEKQMLRFDPTKADHTKYEMNEEETTDHAKKKSKKAKEPEELTPKIASDSTFYKITDSLKQSLTEKSSFSLLSSFGVADINEQKNDETTNEYTAKDISNSKNRSKINSFQCESSDDEGDNRKNVNVKEISNEESLPSHSLTNVGGVWRDNFFFSPNDQRLKDACAFILKSREEKRYENFAEVRQKIKSIVRTKVRNSEHKHRPFQRKLGGRRVIRKRK